MLWVFYTVVVLIVFVYVAGRRYGRRIVVPLNWRRLQQVTTGTDDVRLWFTQIWASWSKGAAALKSRPATPPLTIDTVESELESSPRTIDLSVTARIVLF